MESVVDDKTVAVAVKKGKYSQLAVKWAVENLANKTVQSLLLLHVRFKSEAFGGAGGRLQFRNSLLANHCEEVASGLQQSYKETLDLHVQEMFSPLVSYCKKKNVRFEEVLIEDDGVVEGIADYVFKNNIDVLVVGSGSRGRFLRRLKGPETAGKIAKRAPYFCTVYTVGKGGVVSTKSAFAASQNLSTLNSVKYQERGISDHVRLTDSIMEPSVSVRSREPLIQSRSVHEFKFRSRLQSDGDSEFTSGGGHPPPDSDISFISSDKPYDHISPSFSINSSNYSLGSFNSWQTSSSVNSSVMSSATTSEVSNLSQFTMDEVRKLQLELMQTKKLYEVACQEALAAKHLASRVKSQKIHDDKELYSYSSTSLAKLEINKDETARRITLIKKRISELNALQTF